MSLALQTGETCISCRSRVNFAFKVRYEERPGRICTRV
jgi:hypothetical protein